MILTEDEAWELWCPMRPRYLKPGGMDVADDCKCIAGRCALWRWAQKKVVWPGIRGEGLKQAIESTPQAPTRGYCGLAGRPG